jgi:tetratricopeptide (TPR) repeat protein
MSGCTSILPWRLPILVLIAVVAAPSTRGTAQQEIGDTPAEFHSAYRQATALVDQRQLAEALPLLEELALRSPGDDGLWAWLAQAYEVLGRPADAIHAAGRAVEHGTRFDAFIAYRVARLHAGLGQPDSALVWLERALAMRWENRPGIAGDPAFEAMRGDPRFVRITGAPDRELTRDEGWRHDLAYLVEEARRLHAHPDRPAYSAAFDSAAATLHARIPELSNDRILVEIERLMVRLGDGHTGIFGVGPDTPLDFDAGSLPVRFHEFSDGLFIVDGVGEARRWVGHQVVGIGPRPARDLLDELPAYVHHDNAMTVKWLGVRYMLPGLAFLHAAGATDDPSRATLILRARDGTEHAVTLDGGDHAGAFPARLGPPVTGARGGAPTPRYLRDMERNYWIEAIPDHEAVYFQFNQVRDVDGGATIAAFADTLRETLDRSGARHLIIDVRHNNGGNNGLLRPLVRALVWWELGAPDRGIYVIAGRNTFSAAQNFINQVERWTDAVFVGEPSSSRPNFTGESTNLLLPYSRVRGSISSRYWQDSGPLDSRPWIAPRVPARLSSDDYFSNRDPALEALLEVIARASAG